MFGSELNIVRLARYCGSETGNRPWLKATDTNAVRLTAIQYAGYSRTARELTNERGLRSHALSSTTNPLIVKNRSTPRYPYRATTSTCGKCIADVPSAYEEKR